MGTQKETSGKERKKNEPLQSKACLPGHTSQVKDTEAVCAWGKLLEIENVLVIHGCLSVLLWLVGLLPFC